jgi:glyoxylase-like metal-dependent hydrolase (beta-lactamase superfamily II)
MSDAIEFVKTAPVAGVLEPVGRGIRRFVAPNAGPFTFTGTCAYVVGEHKVAVIDPGPEDPAHVAALLSALESERVAAILVTHTHRDHSPGARLLSSKTGAPIIGCGPHVAARALGQGETNRMEGSGDMAHAPDRILTDGEEAEAAGHRFRAIHTPGHTMNHLCFALESEGVLFSGDHVMGWSTSIVAPPDGSMGAYMASLEKLRQRGESIYFPGHGGAVSDPQRYLRGLVGHRKMRESAILACLGEGAATIAAMTPKLYAGLDPKLLPAAGLSVFAHLEDLVAKGLAATDGPPMLDGTYRKG